MWTSVLGSVFSQFTKQEITKIEDRLGFIHILYYVTYKTVLKVTIRMHFQQCIYGVSKLCRHKLYDVISFLFVLKNRKSNRLLTKFHIFF